ncbi:MAG: hypothetical protein K2J80_00655 [Oscillospiraceae bacterium]|nr:hypothetical protein [Oscillospiraceae bacterium]
MKIGKYPVKHSYKLARIISDVMSLAVAVVILNTTRIFFENYKKASIVTPEKLVELAKEQGIWWLANRHKFAWVFPGLVAVIFAAYLILTLKSHKFAKYNVTKQSAQAVYDWYAFAVSLCKLPLLLGVFDMMYIFHQRMMFNKVSLFSVQMVLDILIIAIIIRLSVHRIRWMTKTEKPAKAAESGGVKAKIADENEDSE